MHDAVARGGGNYHDHHTQGRCPLLCNTAPLGRDDICLMRKPKANTDSQPRRFHAQGASTLHGMTLAVRFWCCGRTRME